MTLTWKRAVRPDGLRVWCGTDALGVQRGAVSTNGDASALSVWAIGADGMPIHTRINNLDDALAWCEEQANVAATGPDA